MRGEWKQAYDTLASLPCWALLADKDKVLSMLRSKLQEQGLTVYLLAYGSFYHSLSHKHLNSLFELSPDKVCPGHCAWQMSGRPSCMVSTTRQSQFLLLGQGDCPIKALPSSRQT